MSSFESGVLFGIGAVLILDAGGSLLSQHFKFPYARLSPISFSIWAIAATIASNGVTSSPVKSLALGGLSGFIVGLFDSTVGWWISWRLGAGRLKPELVTPGRIAKITIRVTLFSAIIGAFTSLLFALIH